MILLFAILKVANGKPFNELEHQSTDVLGQASHTRTIRQARLLDIRMSCPSGMRYVGGRCRRIFER